jgi:hypothetical protein
MGYSIMAWVKWDSIENFNTWHDAIKAELGLPKLSVDAEGNTIPDSLINENYTLPVIVANNDIRARVEDEYETGLEAADNPIVSNYETNPL